MSDIFVILGVSNGGLFLSRQLRKRFASASIIAIGDKNTDFGRYSNTIDQFHSVGNFEDLRFTVKKLVESYYPKKLKAFFCSNNMLEWGVNKVPEIFDSFEFENSLDIYRLFVDKTILGNYCSRLGVLVPKEYCLADSFEEGEFQFPCVIKPNSKMDSIGAQKCKVVNNIIELSSYIKTIESIGISRNNIICQQFISGNNRNEFGYGGYFIDGIPVLEICFNQIHQYPQGLSTKIVEVIDNSVCDQIKEIVLPFLGEIKYTGLVECDIKRDEVTNNYYLLDINPRPWRSCDMLCAKLSKGTIFNPIIKDNRIVWIDIVRELLARRSRGNDFCQDSPNYPHGLPRNYSIATFDKYDIIPFLKYTNMGILKILSSIKNKFFF